MDDGAEPGFTICHCTGVERAAVLAALATGARSVAELRAATGVCSGCRTCACDLEVLLAARGEVGVAPPMALRGAGVRKR